ncbi:Y-family DNA polymerase [Varibaculum massiliense]|uniref:Y-family DNA polymerase n=1 Tax=Varibaculum massiliense TaxID=1852372 RepID=UPI0008DA4B93|nr:hypothetical protein [Varibaculum massiliense]
MNDRLLALYIPEWPAQAAKLPLDEAVALCSGGRVQAVTAPARAAGIRPQMRLKQARVLCPSLKEKSYSLAEAELAFQPVIEVAAQQLYAPKSWFPGLVTAALSRSQRHAESALAAELTEQLAQVGFAVQIGIARGTLAACLAAREQLLVSDSGVKPLLSAEPLSSLGFFLRPGIKISGFDFSDHYLTKMTDSLTHLGITSLGQMCALGRPALIRRFGTLGAISYDLASGENLEEAARVKTAPASPGLYQFFTPPASSLTQLLLPARALVVEMYARLRASGQVCTQVQFICRCENGKLLSRSWNLGVEVSSKDLVERIKYQLEAVTVGGSGSEALGAVSQIELHPLRAVDARQAMTPLWGRNADPPQEVEQAARSASSLLGKCGVRVPQLTSGYDPRSVIELKPWQERGRQKRPRPRVGALTGVAPEIVFMHPKPAGIIDSRGRKILPGRDGQLKSPVKWVQVAGRKIEVQKTEGPWPINGQWWRPGVPNHLGPRIFLRVYGEQETLLLVFRKSSWWLDAWEGQK